MMIRVICDSCRGPIDRDEGDWYGVDWTPPAVAAPDDVDDDTIVVELHEIAQDHEFHFCTVSCLNRWTMEREFTPSEGTTA